MVGKAEVTTRTRDHSPTGAVTKPAYRIPLMTEIASIEPNGYTVVSTFSGCGGSCLGFRMAGFRPLWASEFIPEAAATYRANHPETPLSTSDIRAVDPGDILKRLGLVRGAIDVLEGSPPCASFSTAGKREADWGKVTAYSDTKQRVDDLFFEYARLVDGLQPKVFVAENVSGLVKGTAKGYFIEILRALKACGYVVQAKLLDAQWLGVPQARQRIIFVGVRNDLVERYGVVPAFPKPLPYRYSVRDALPWIAEVSGRTGPGEARTPSEIDYPMNAVLVQDPAQTRYEVSDRSPRAYRDKRGAFGNDGDCTDTPAPTVLADSVGTHWITGVGTAKGTRSIDEPSPTVRKNDRAKTTSELTLAIEPEADISRYAIGREWDRTAQGASNERYFSLKRASTEQPSQTVTQRGGDAGVASVTHPTERRKFSIAELRRICGFPDDFILTGTYAQQWERLGRAVPPPMMAAVATVIRDQILRRIPDGN